MRSLAISTLLLVLFILPSGVAEKRLSPNEKHRSRFQDFISPPKDPSRLAQSPWMASVAFAVISIIVSTANLTMAWLFVRSIHFKDVQATRLAVHKLDRCIWLMERRAVADDILDRLMVEAQVDVAQNNKDRSKIIRTLN